MTSRGAYAAVSNKSLNIETLNLEANTNNQIQWINGGVGSCGRGGNGAARSIQGTAHGGGGAAGTISSGGAGGGGAACNHSNYTRSGGGGTANGGPGGTAACACDQNSCGAGGGAGNGGGGGSSCGGGVGYAGSSGTGGLIILIVRGKLTIGPNGIISANGAAGGGSSYAGGGGSGGGSITLIYGSSYSNSGTVQANGGSGGSGTYYGGGGSVGSIRVLQLSQLAITPNYSLFNLPNPEPTINRWIHDGDSNSLYGHFEQKLTSTLISNDSIIQINNSWYRIITISGDGTGIKSVLLDKICYTGKIGCILPLYVSPTNTISLSKNIANNTSFTFMSSVNSQLDLTEIDNITSMVLTCLNNVKIAFSFDSCKTWKTYNNGWLPISITDISQSGMSSSDIDLLTQQSLNHILNETKLLNYAISLTYTTGLVPSFESFVINGYKNTYSMFDKPTIITVNNINISSISTFI